MNDLPIVDPRRLVLESTSVVLWRIDWRSRCFAYVSPQIERLLGWPPASWRTIDDWCDRIHPDDRDRVFDFCVERSAAGIDHEAAYRALTSQGDHVWVRDIVHVVRDANGVVDSLVGFLLRQSDPHRTQDCASDAFEHQLSVAGARYRLTPAEQRVAVYLARGCPAKRIAQLAGVAVPTVRAQVQSIMRKTGTQRQIQLLSVLLSPAKDAGRPSARS